MGAAGATGVSGPTGPTGAAPTGATGPTGAGSIVDTTVGGISAAGTTQAGATQLTAQFNIVTTVAAGAGVALPAGVTGTHCLVRNSGVNALLIYPRNGDSAAINNGATNAAVAMQPNMTAYFESQGVTQWFTVP